MIYGWNTSYEFSRVDLTPAQVAVVRGWRCRHSEVITEADLPEPT